MFDLRKNETYRNAEIYWNLGPNSWKPGKVVGQWSELYAYGKIIFSIKVIFNEECYYLWLNKKITLAVVPILVSSWHVSVVGNKSSKLMLWRLCSSPVFFIKFCWTVSLLLFLELAWKNKVLCNFKTCSVLLKEKLYFIRIQYLL